MFNLLPDILKARLKSEYRLRHLIVILGFVIFLQITFLIFLSPSWVITFYKEKDAVSMTNLANQSVSSTTSASLSAVIVGTNDKLKVLNNSLQYLKVTNLMNVIISNKTSSISVSEMSYTSTNASSTDIIIGGVSLSREALVSFVKKLKDSKLFSKVDLPVSNLAKDKNIQFSINIST